MHYEWDPEKNRKNIDKHGIAFEAMSYWDWSLSLLLDVQVVSGEERELSVSPLTERLFAVVVTERGETLRVISLRRATNAEIRAWRKEFQHG